MSDHKKPGKQLLHLVFGGEPDPYTISSVASDTSITLTDRWLGDTALTATTYRYYEDEYALASDFHRLVDSRTFTDAMVLPTIGRKDFYARYPRNSQTGTPRVCTIIELGPGTTVALRPRVIFYPAPDSVINIPYRYITTNLAVSSAGVGATDMSADTDEPIIPLRYRHVLVFYALYQWYRDRKDDPRAGPAQQEYTDLVQRMANDTSAEVDKPRLRTDRRRYMAGVAGYHRSSRYSADNRFDELRDR